MRRSICWTFMFVFALALSGCSNGDVKTLASAASQNPTPTDNVFNMDQRQFAAAFNTTAKTLQQPFRIEQIDIKTGAIDDYFLQQFSDDTSLTVAFSKNSGRITSITGLVAEKDGYVDMVALQAIAKVVMATTSPELSKEKIAKIVNDMIHEITAQNEAAIPQRYFDDARYILRSSNSIGFWWIANPA